MRAATALTLTTRSRVPNSTPQELQQFLATPANWPRIVLSSVGVEGAAPASPLRPGSEIDELFGLPASILPLRVKWRCEAAGSNTLDVRSADGLAGVATDCRMDFSIEADGDASVVDLAMSYEPASPLALLAAPVLVVDNWLALNVLLPNAFSGKPIVRQRDAVRATVVFFALLTRGTSASGRRYGCRPGRSGRVTHYVCYCISVTRAWDGAAWVRRRRLRLASSSAMAQRPAAAYHRAEPPPTP